MPQQFGGSRLDYGDFAFRMEGYVAVLSKTTRLQSWEDLLGCPAIKRSDGSCSNNVQPWRGGNAGEEDSQRESRRWASSLVCSHAMVQTQISGGASGVNGDTNIAQAHQKRE